MANDALSGAGTGAALGATVGSAVPVIGTAVGAVAGGLIGGTVGYLKGRKRKKEKDSLDKLINKSPKYELQPEVAENQAIARSEAYGKDRSIQLREQKMEQEASDAVANAKDVTSGTSGLLSTISAIKANQASAGRDLAITEAQLQSQKKSQLMAVNQQVIDEKDKAWNYNNNMPFQMKVAALRDRIRYGEQQSAQEAANAQNSIIGMFGGFGGGNVSSFGGAMNAGRASSGYGAGYGGPGWTPSDLNKPM